MRIGKAHHLVGPHTLLCEETVDGKNLMPVWLFLCMDCRPNLHAPSIGISPWSENGEISMTTSNYNPSVDADAHSDERCGL